MREKRWRWANVAQHIQCATMLARLRPQSAVRCRWMLRFTHIHAWKLHRFDEHIKLKWNCPTGFFFFALYFVHRCEVARKLKREREKHPMVSGQRPNACADATISSPSLSFLSSIFLSCSDRKSLAHLIAYLGLPQRAFRIERASNFESLYKVREVNGRTIAHNACLRLVAVPQFTVRSRSISWSWDTFQCVRPDFTRGTKIERRPLLGRNMRPNTQP